MIRYQILMALALPVVLAQQALRGPKGGVAARLGHVPAPAPGPGLRLWLHAASVGEVTSARWVIEAVLAARPGLQMLVTCNSATGRDRVAAWGLAGVTPALAPFDSAGSAARVLDLWEPRALIIVENELWPARIAAAHRRGVPVLVIGARMSARSAARWRWFAGLMAETLDRVAWLSAQDPATLQRLTALGLPKTAAGPIVALKSMGQAQTTQPPFPPPAPRHRTLLAASTHSGEDATILAAFQSARDQFDHLILAPRHPNRSAEIQTLLAAQSTAFATRSKGEIPGPQTPVYLADTLGEMEHWYAMAGTCIIGGTFAPKGGHTPWEPARHAMAMLHGPHVENFAAPFAALDQAGATIATLGAEDLGTALRSLDAKTQTRMATLATEVLAPKSDGAAVITAILATIRH